MRANGVRQRHIDQAQSMNFYITQDYTLRQVLNLYILAWKSGVKTVYYVRSKSLEVEECESCSSEGGLTLRVGLLQACRGPTPPRTAKMGAFASYRLPLTEPTLEKTPRKPGNILCMCRSPTRMYFVCNTLLRAC